MANSKIVKVNEKIAEKTKNTLPTDTGKM